MSSIPTRSKALAVGVLCAAGGAGAGAVATATASTNHSSGHATAHHARAATHPRMRDLRGLAHHSVAGSVVVHTRDGYRTITFERGTVSSVSGDQLTITEGVAGAPYKTATVTVPSTATVRDDGQQSSLSSVTAGQRVLVVQGPERTIVRAHTPKAGATS